MLKVDNVSDRTRWKREERNSEPFRQPQMMGKARGEEEELIVQELCKTVFYAFT